MGRLRTLLVLSALGAWGAATDGAPPGDGDPAAPAPPAASSRPASPAPPGQYVAAVARLHKEGNFELAAQYLKAADEYRDLLTPAEQASADRYRQLLTRRSPAAPADPAVQPAAATQPGPAAAATPAATTPAPTPSPGAAPGSARGRAEALVAQARQALTLGQTQQAAQLAREAEALGAPFTADEDSPARVLSDLAQVGQRSPRAVLGRANPGEANSKQTARWLLHSAKEQIRQGDYDGAAQKIAQARALNVKYRLYEETPDQVAKFLDKARPKAAATAGAPGDRKQARAKLDEARRLLAARQYDQAEAIALEVGAWDLHWGLIGDSPTKVAAAARSLRNREALRRAGPAARNSEALYSQAVAESRQLMAAGRMGEAEAKARVAQQMNVVPPVTADRAEAVLHDIAMTRAGGTPTVAADPSVQKVQAEAPAADAPTPPLSEPTPAPAVAAAPAPPTAPPAASPAPAAPIVAEPAPAPAVAGPVAVPDLSPAAPPAAPAAATAPAAPSGGMLDQARALMAAGNFAAARQAAEKAKQEGAGLEADAVLTQVAQAQQAAVLNLYEAAVASARKGDAAHARALLDELTGADIDDATQQRVQDLLMKLPKDPAGRAQVVEDAEAVKAQKANAEVGTKVAEARRLMETDPDKAIEMLGRTLVAVKADDLPDASKKMLSRRLEVAIELARKDKVAFDEKMKDKAYRAEIERKKLRILEADTAKQKRLKELMDKAQEAMAAGKFDEAEKFARMANQIDPNEIAPLALANVANVRRHYERDKQIRRDKDESALNILQGVDEASIVSLKLQQEGIDVGKGFASLTRNRRELAYKLARKKPPKTLEIEAALNKPVTIPNADKMTLGEALKYLADYSGLNIQPDHGALAEEGLTLNSPVNLTATNNVKLKSVLKYMLSPLHLTYTVDDEVLLITSPQANRAKTETVVYNVADLVLSPHARAKRDGAAPAANLANAGPGVDGAALQAQAAQMVNNGTPANLPTTATGPQGQSWAAEREAPDFQPLIQLIKASIAPGTWSDVHTPADEMGPGGSFGRGAGFGGGADAAAGENAIGSITPFFLNISLIIRHTAEVHDEIVDLLRQLRRLQDLQISIEVRFITVSDSFFEQIGVDFDFSIQSDVVGRKSSFAIPNPAATAAGTGTGGGGAQQAVNPYLINPQRDHSLGSRLPVVVGRQSNGNTGNFSPDLQIPFLQGSANNIAPFNAVPNVGATLGVAFLSDLEVYLFLTAAQGDQRSNLVQAPKVTTFNGAPATVINVTNRFFVQSLVPVIAAGAVAFQPNIQALPDGVILNVTPVVSADRRYVRMTLSPFFQTFIQFDTFQIPAAVGGGGLGGQASTVTAQVQLPVTSVTNIQTTVTVPDGGTVLLGGVKRLRETRAEFGVPILSKTPLINRLFRNIGIGRTTDSLMLMVTPRIIILEEEEERLGIPAVQNITF